MRVSLKEPWVIEAMVECTKYAGPCVVVVCTSRSLPTSSRSICVGGGEIKLRSQRVYAQVYP